MPAATATARRRASLRREIAALEAQYVALAEAVYGGEGLADFIRRVSPHLPPPRHTAPLIRMIERCRTEQVRACVSFPPGHAKSTTLLHGIAWLLSRNPLDINAYVTNGEALARSQSRKARAWATGAGLVLAHDSASLTEWRTARGGGLLATSIEGPLGGQRVTGLLVIDDPYKNRQDADSPRYREMVSTWEKEVAQTRLERASEIIVSTRWHPEDIIGEVAEDHGFEYLNMAAIAEEGVADPLGRQPGEALWPEMYPLEDLGARRSRMGEWAFQALYQGHPRPKGAGVFGEPSWYDPNTQDLKGFQVWIGADPAASKSTYADHSVGIVGAFRGADVTRELFVLDVARGQWTVPELTRKLRALQARWYGAPVAVECVGGFKAVAQIMREADPNLRIIEVYPSLDKFQRAQPVAAAWNGGRVHLPQGRPWTAALVKELTSFTGLGDAEDDQVDALAHLWNAGNQPVVERRAVAQPERWR